MHCFGYSECLARTVTKAPAIGNATISKARMMSRVSVEDSFLPAHLSSSRIRCKAPIRPGIRLNRYLIKRNKRRISMNMPMIPRSIIRTQSKLRIAMTATIPFCMPTNHTSVFVDVDMYRLARYSCG
ncbi:hypothetical protein ABW21_db0206382 [Orbilia brochopaga]|nr:hypothetical protein ABW21_db0206382 [Drechslerella brochopaga]